MTYLLFVVGLLGLFFGGEYLVRGASSIARRFGISPLVIGLTIVGFGTSAPEMLVSVNAALAGQPAIAIGNVLGSNIANILLILGVSALIAPLIIPARRLARDLAFMLLATGVIWVMLLDGMVSRIEGGVLRLSSGRGDADAGSWWLRVEDDGLGLSPHARDQVGLSNLRQRLEQHYGTKAWFTLRPLSTGGTRANLGEP
ncbi:MAG: hypothetical protein RL128_1416, partial [Pseudomonadota bacterium]